MYPPSSLRNKTWLFELKPPCATTMSPPSPGPVLEVTCILNFVRLSFFLSDFIFFFKLYAQHGAGIHDPEIQSHTPAEPARHPSEASLFFTEIQRALIMSHVSLLLTKSSSIWYSKDFSHSGPDFPGVSLLLLTSSACSRGFTVKLQWGAERGVHRPWTLPLHFFVHIFMNILHLICWNHT